MRRTTTVTTTAVNLVSISGALVPNAAGTSASANHQIQTGETYVETSYLYASIPIPTLPSSAQDLTLESVTLTDSYVSAVNAGAITITEEGTATLRYGNVERGEASQLETEAGHTTALSVGSFTEAELLSDQLNVLFYAHFVVEKDGTGLTVPWLVRGTVTAIWSYTYEVPLLGNTVSFGGGKAVIGGAVSSNISGTTYQTMGSTSMTSIAQADASMFTFSDGVFTCVKPGNYTVYFYGRGAYNSSGTARYMYYKMFKNGTVVKSVTSGTSIGTGGYTTTYTADFAKDDTFYIQGAVNSGSLAMSGGYIISLN